MTLLIPNTKKLNKQLLKDINEYFGEENKDLTEVKEDFDWYLRTMFVWYKEANKYIDILQKQISDLKGKTK